MKRVECQEGKFSFRVRRNAVEHLFSPFVSVMAEKWAEAFPMRNR